MTSFTPSKVWLFCQFSRCDTSLIILSFSHLTATSQPRRQLWWKQGKSRRLQRREKERSNEPQKPVSAYALFFRDTQAAIKGQNPNALLERFQKLLLLCGTVLEKSKNRWANNGNNVIEFLRIRGIRLHAGPVAKTPLQMQWTQVLQSLVRD